MIEQGDSWFDGRARAVAVEVNTDARGTLAALELGAIGLPVVRSFTVTAPGGTSRGGHGHHRVRQLLRAVSGEIEVEMKRFDRTVTATLGATGPALLIEPGIWARQTYRGESAILLVLCDLPFDPADYFSSVAETF